jgi:hypothetical protein
LADNDIIISKKARTSYHIFVLKCIIDKYLKCGGKILYACFVDFHKAFDTVIHVGIMYKLQLQNINGYFFHRILKSMYKIDKLYIKVDNKMTEFFTAEVGVRQGVVLNPNLFNLFINDFPKLLEENTDSVTLDNTKIPCLLFADDLILFF